MRLHAKYQGSTLCGFKREDFFHVSPYKSLCKHVTSGRDHFWPPGYNLNKLGRGLLGDATYQISRLYALWFQTRRFFQYFPYISLCKQCDPRVGPFLAPGA